MKLRGYRFVNNLPEGLKSFVLIGAPHTSNWDFVTAMTVIDHLEGDAHFVIKDDWMKFPLNYFFKAIGAIGLDRSQIKASMTDIMANYFKGNDQFILLISPEGTRKPNAKWKTGFYYIAEKANVPIVLAYVDKKTKTVGLGKVIYPTNFKTDMQIISDFYADKVGEKPQNFLLPTLE